jgi:hypothetical protein
MPQPNPGETTPILVAATVAHVPHARSGATTSCWIPTEQLANCTYPLRRWPIVGMRSGLESSSIIRINPRATRGVTLPGVLQLGPGLSSRIHQPAHEYERQCGESFEHIAPERAVSYHEVDQSDDTRDSKQNGRYRIVLHLDMLSRPV